MLSADKLRSLDREAALLSKIAHPNVVSLNESGVAKGRAVGALLFTLPFEPLNLINRLRALIFPLLSVFVSLPLYLSLAHAPSLPLSLSLSLYLSL